jgi:hypothetical protein
VVAEDVGERMRARIERVDVGVGIDENELVELTIKAFAEVERHGNCRLRISEYRLGNVLSYYDWNGAAS